MKYLIRSVKYFCAMCVLCIALMGLMIATGSSALSLDDTIYAMLHTDRYLVMLLALVAVSALYPKFGFTSRQMIGDVEKDNEQIINAMRSGGFVLVSQEDGQMVFQAEAITLKLMLLFEDQIVVSQQGDYITIDGIRRGVARVAYRLDSYLESKRRNE